MYKKRILTLLYLLSIFSLHIAHRGEEATLAVVEPAKGGWWGGGFGLMNWWMLRKGVPGEWRGRRLLDDEAADLHICTG